MSYLDVPRVHFAGRFFADPSTINNDPKHWVPGNFSRSPWQEPRGLHYFRLVECTVRSGLTADGPVADDALIGAPVETTDDPAPAKIADLDVYQQDLPSLFGMQIRIPITDEVSLTGDVFPQPELNSAYFMRMLPTRGWNEDYGAGSYGADTNASGVFQTLLQVPVDSWPRKGVSKLLDELAAKTQRGPSTDPLTDQPREVYFLSIKCTTDGYVNVPWSEEFEYGRITGAIGPWHDGEPVQAPGPRWLKARDFDQEKAPWNWPYFYACPFQVDAARGRLVIDLANALCLQKWRGEPVNLGVLKAHVDVGGKSVELGIVPKTAYSQFGYENNACICEVPLSHEQLELVGGNPVSLRTSRKDIGDPKVLYEDPSGFFFAVDTRSWRMTPDGDTSKAITRLRCTQWGRPAAGKQVSAVVVPVTGKTPGATVPPDNPGDTPQAHGALAVKVNPSDALGWSTVEMQVVKDPGSRTPWLDSQLYFIWLYEGDEPPIETGASAEVTISVVAWAAYEVQKDPSWDEVQRLLEVYAHLYPGMTELFDVTDEHAFQVFADNPPWFVSYGVPHGYSVQGISSGAIPFMLTRTDWDPRLMPVTRDMAPNRVQTVLNYIKKIQKPVVPSPPPPEADK